MTTPAVDRVLAALTVDIVAFAVCDIAPDACIVIPPLDLIEVHFVLEGVLHLRCGSGPAIVAGPGDVIVIPTGCEQAMSGSAEATRRLLSRDICRGRPDGLLMFDAGGDEPQRVRIMCGEIRADVCGSYGLFEGLRAPIHAALGGEPLVRAAVTAMLHESGAPCAGTGALSGALMKACLVLLLRDCLSRPGGASAMPGLFARPSLARAVAAVLDRPSAGHSVASLAAISGMSRSGFAKEFLAGFGTTPMEFVARIRIARGRDLLLSTGLPIATVASNAGFASRSHFSRTFRSAFGADPSRYRLNNMAEVAHDGAR